MIINYETYVLIILIILIILIFHIHLYFNKIEEFTTPDSIYGNYENHTGKYGIKCVKDCQTGYAGPNCNTVCDPIKGEIPRDDKTACKTIGNNEYIGPNREVIKFTSLSDKYRNPDDATHIITLPDDKYRHPLDGWKILNISDKSDDGDIYRLKDSNLLYMCPVCTTTQYSTGSCGGSTVNDKECIDYPIPPDPPNQTIHPDESGKLGSTTGGEIITGMYANNTSRTEGKTSFDTRGDTVRGSSNNVKYPSEIIQAKAGDVLNLIGRIDTVYRLLEYCEFWAWLPDGNGNGNSWSIIESKYATFIGNRDFSVYYTIPSNTINGNYALAVACSYWKVEGYYRSWKSYSLEVWGGYQAPVS
jgi:hypothetical protein